MNLMETFEAGMRTLAIKLADNLIATFNAHALKILGQPASKAIKISPNKSIKKLAREADAAGLEFDIKLEPKAESKPSKSISKAQRLQSMGGFWHRSDSRFTYQVSRMPKRLEVDSIIHMLCVENGSKLKVNRATLLNHWKWQAK